MQFNLPRMFAIKAEVGDPRAEEFADDGRPQTELNFKFYRQATNKIIGISDEAAAFLRAFFGVLSFFVQ